MKASHYGILNLKRVIKNLPEWTYESNDIYHTNLKRSLGNVFNQYRRYMGHVSRNIGGVEYNYRTVDEPGAVYTPTSREKQLLALDFIDEHVFTCPSWLIDEPFVARLYPRPADLTDKYCEDVLNNYIFDISGWIVGDAFNEELPFEDYLEEVVFGGNTGEEIAPTKEDVEGFNAYIENYKACLPAEAAAVKSKK
jgi:hypothetical protein